MFFLKKKLFPSEKQKTIISKNWSTEIENQVDIIYLSKRLKWLESLDVRWGRLRVTLDQQKMNLGLCLKFEAKSKKGDRLFEEGG